MTYCPCPPELVDRVVSETFDAPLLERRFVKTSARKYVRSRIPGVRDVIELRGDTLRLILVWGFSLDFVPHIAGRDTETVRWHRTAKSAISDLRYSGLGGFYRGPKAPGCEISFIHGESRMREQAGLSRRLLLPRVLEELDSMQHLNDFRKLFEIEERRAGNNFFIFPQVTLAYAFYLAKIGDEHKARNFMSAWLEHSSLREETEQKLAALFEEAVTSPLITQ